MRIDFFCESGSPIGIVPADLYGKGVGGAELSLISLAEALAAQGHEVWIYNDPETKPLGLVQFAKREDFLDSHPADAFILFRNPSKALRASQAEVKLFWSCDQFTTGDYRNDIFPYVDHVVTISPYHQRFLQAHWKADPRRMGCLDLGVRLQDYEGKSISRIPNQLIFCSIPDRGLAHLWTAWKEIKKQIPSATLIITGDYTLWGAPSAGTHPYKLLFAGDRSVRYLGNIPRKELVEYQLQSQLFGYPCIYPELFCVSVAECQVAGAVPITSDCGALSTTNQWGVCIPGEASTAPWLKTFADTVITYLREGAEELRLRSMEGSSRRFNWDSIARQWIDLIEHGRFPL